LADWPIDAPIATAPLAHPPRTTLVSDFIRANISLLDGTIYSSTSVKFNKSNISTTELVKLRFCVWPMRVSFEGAFRDLVRRTAYCS
jgi:hypothetical protein